MSNKKSHSKSVTDNYGALHCESFDTHFIGFFYRDVFMNGKFIYMCRKVCVPAQLIRHCNANGERHLGLIASDASRPPDLRNHFSAIRLTRLINIESIISRYQSTCVKFIDRKHRNERERNARFGGHYLARATHAKAESWLPAQPRFSGTCTQKCTVRYFAQQTPFGVDGHVTASRRTEVYCVGGRFAYEASHPLAMSKGLNKWAGSGGPIEISLTRRRPMALDGRAPRSRERGR
ncbi:hypothetical protein EVAR_59997_1 [Eumeta japonica]|uniref:Uncharacterized protein n=1 Tax=Eumeta variegata TaxID=151549 RepID=A0A4C1ZGJ8_EUMVA|nr:hypothetical protein EVAR_59997_1 [Eumeta japonica]